MNTYIHNPLGNDGDTEPLSKSQHNVLKNNNNQESKHIIPAQSQNINRILIFILSFLDKSYRQDKIRYQLYQKITIQIKDYFNFSKHNFLNNEMKCFTELWSLLLEDNFMQDFEVIIETTMLQEQLCFTSLKINVSDKYYLLISIFDKKQTKEYQPEEYKKPDQKENTSYHNNYDFYQQSVMKGGLYNLQSSCYINSALQALRQIYQRDSSFFDSSLFGKKLKDLYERMDRQDNIKSILVDLKQISKRYQEHTHFGGDSYSTLLNFIEEFKNTSSSQTMFNKKFIFNSQDGLECSHCKTFRTKETDDYYFFKNEEIGCEASSIQEAFQPKSVYNQSKFLKCNSCWFDSYQQPRKMFTYLPEFMIIRLITRSKYGQRSEYSYEFHQNYECQTSNGILHEYKIIGVCSYTGSHYYYTGLNIQGKWIKYNDSTVEASSPSMDSANYVLLQKIN